MNYTILGTAGNWAACTIMAQMPLRKINYLLFHCWNGHETVQDVMVCTVGYNIFLTGMTVSFSYFNT